MDMKIYLATTIFLLLFLPLDAMSIGDDNNYYNQLKRIESVRLDDIDDARNQLDKISQFESEFNEVEKDLYLLLLAHSKAMQSDYERAKKLLTNLTLQSNSIDIRSRAYSILAAIQNIQGNDIDAFVALDNSLSQLSEVNDQIYRLDILQNAVSVYKESELIEYALELSRRHLTEAIRSNKSEPLCHANYELASIEIMAQKTKIAEERLKATRQHCEEADQKLVLLEIDASLAQIAMINERYDRAEKIMEDRYKDIELYGWGILTSRASIIYSEIFLVKNRLKEAEKYATEAYRMAKDSQDKKRTLEAAAVLAKIYSQKKDNEKAIKYYKEYMELNNELRTKVRQRKLAFQSTRETENLTLRSRANGR